MKKKILLSTIIMCMLIGCGKNAPETTNTETEQEVSIIDSLTVSSEDGSVRNTKISICNVVEITDEKMLLKKLSEEEEYYELDAEYAKGFKVGDLVSMTYMYPEEIRENTYSVQVKTLSPEDLDQITMQ